jgi:hypothetical protein
MLESDQIDFALNCAANMEWEMPAFQTLGEEWWHVRHDDARNLSLPIL